MELRGKKITDDGKVVELTPDLIIKAAKYSPIFSISDPTQPQDTRTNCHKDEWQKFLTLLAKYRKKEPLNGLVVTVAANKLVESGFEALEEDGRSIRRRIDELMRVLGAKFPVYVLVTKCDLIQGMTQFCDSLPEKSLDQAMGRINHDLSKDVTAFHTRAMRVIADRL